MADILELTPLSYVVVLGVALSNLAMGMIEPTIALYLLDIGVSYSGVGKILAARFLVVAIASLPLALFASRVGITNVLYLSGVSAIVAGSVLYFGVGADAVYYFYLVAGLSQAVVSGPGAAILAENKGTKRVAAFALFSTTWMIPPALGAGFSSMWFKQFKTENAEVYASIFPIVFIILIIGGIVFTGLLISVIKRGNKPDESTDKKLPIADQARLLFAPVVVVPIILLTLVNFMMGAGAGSTLPFLPPYLKSLDATSSQISLLVMVLNLVMGIATQFSAPLAGRFGELRVFTITTILSVISLLGIVFSDSLGLASTFYILRGTFANMNSPIVQSRVIAYIEDSVRATGSAWTSTFRWVGWTTFSPISGNLIETYGYEISFIFTSIIYLVATSIFLWTVVNKPNLEELRERGEFKSSKYLE